MIAQQSVIAPRCSSGMTQQIEDASDELASAAFLGAAVPLLLHELLMRCFLPPAARRAADGVVAVWNHYRSRRRC
jgi:hypothetical protein